jgi:hypothetical protein
MKKKELAADIVVLKDQISVIQEQIRSLRSQNHVPRQSASEKKLIKELSEQSRQNCSDISSLNVLYGKNEAALSRIIGAMSEPRSEFRLDLAADVRRVLVSDMTNPETVFGKVLRMIVNGISCVEGNLEDQCNTPVVEKGE